MLTDSHCHLASHKFPADELPTLIADAMASGVTRLVTLATCLGDLETNLSICRDHPSVRSCIGIHPCDVHEAPDDAVDQLRSHLTDPRVCGIGETGLDYFHPAPGTWSEETFRDRQKLMLDQHFTLAAEAGLNVVIHTRDRTGSASFEEALAIYRKHAHHARAVFHCFISTRENARRVIDLGGLVSFGGVATFKNAKDVLDVAADLPTGTFMVETDSPYLAPHPHRGSRNEPALVRVVAEKLAEARGETVADLAGHTTATAEDFFRLS
ncbi:TatD family hydrolase [Haloferula rosea]|uniref:TatD family hydrolase n=1 Tax=Haloferula rosea TaxID=490093 RepID=A0A934RCC1_9BACT|nr:TatD family hydrolase [Haloferula rosea]MBK1826992.1 TatD family hydrolase [Haloferula rosea]